MAYIIQQGDYRDLIPQHHDIQAIITDPPYNTTGCEWDGAFDPREFWRVITPQLAPQCVVIMTAQMRLATALIHCATIPFRHDLVWEKPNGTGQVRHSPNRCHELILIFGRGTPHYTAQMQKGTPYTWSSTRSRGEATGYRGAGTITNTGTRHPRSVLKIPQQRGLHPTQKPTALWRFLIESYIPTDCTIYDPFGGAGVTPVTCEALNRDSWMCDVSQEYCDVARQRLE